MLHLREILLSLIIIIPSIAAHAADGRTMTDKLTCYNYEERIVFILDLKKDNEKLNRMSLAVVKRTKDSIELTAPDLLVKFDSINFVLDVVPSKASEALSMECTPY